MREHDVRTVLMVRAFEEADADRLLLTAAERSRATEAARAAHAEDPQALILTRAQDLFGVLNTRCASLEPLVRGDLPRWLVVGGLALPALLGLFFGDTLGLVRGTTLSVLSAPLLSLLAWNLAVYVYLFWRLFQRRDVGRRSESAPVAGPPGLLARLALRGVRRGMGRVSARRAEEQVVVGRALTRWAALSGRDSSELLGARVRLLLHFAALQIVVVAIGVMYARGLTSEFRATWESTFLSAHGVQALVDTVLGPAARLLSREIPDVAALQAPADAPAALWVHLYAVTALLAVVVPRLLLALWERVRIRRLRREHPFDVEDPVYQRLIHGSRVQAATVELRPYSLQLDARRRDALMLLLHEIFGVRADVSVGEPISYGEDWEAPQAAGDGGCVAILFPLGQSPESEVHGALLVEAREQLAEGDRLLVLLESSRYRERLGGVDDRLAERQRAWERVVREAGLSVAHVDLGRPSSDEELLGVESAVWPDRSAGAVA